MSVGSSEFLVGDWVRGGGGGVEGREENSNISKAYYFLLDFIHILCDWYKGGLVMCILKVWVAR
jgi:hypothetical protein